MAIVALATVSCQKDKGSDNVDIKVTTVGTRELYSDQVTLVGKVEHIPSIIITQKGFYYDTVRITKSSLSELKVFADDDFTALVDNLEPQRTYSMIAFVVTSRGDVYYGSPQSFTTTPPANIEISALPATEVTGKSAKLTGKVDDDGGIPASKFGCKYWIAGTTEPEDIDTEFFEGAPTKVVSKGEKFYPLLTGLTPGTTYSYRLFGQNDSKGKYTDIFTFSTLALVAPAVQNGTVGDIGPTMATISGCEILSNGNDPDITWGVVYKASPGLGETPDETWTDMPITDTTGMTFSATLTNLIYNTTYGFAAYVKNDLQLVYSAVVTFDTENAAVPAMTTVAAVAADYNLIKENDEDAGKYNIGFDHALINGTLISNGGVDITKYGFDYGTDPSLTVATREEIGSVIADGESFSFDITGLNANTTYYYRAFAVNGIGDGTGDIKSFRTGIDGKKLLYTEDLSRAVDVPATLAESETTLVYYELPAITPTSGVKYYFLDRNLGATRQASDNDLTYTEPSINIGPAIGYYYQFAQPMPITATDVFYWISTNVCDGSGNAGNWAGGGYYTSPIAYGWNIVASNKDSWTGTDNPCPTGYEIPTKADFEDIITWFGTEGLDAQAVKELLRFVGGGFRHATKGGLGSGRGASFWTSTGDAGLAQAYFFQSPIVSASTNNKTCGVPVRCVRIVR